jgi:hypothetical protein
MRFSFQVCVKSFGLSYRCLKKDNYVHDVPCNKCLTKVILTLSGSFSILPTKVTIFEGCCTKYKDLKVHIQVCAKYTNLSVSN